MEIFIDKKVTKVSVGLTEGVMKRKGSKLEEMVLHGSNECKIVLR
jgi:hypothetical protein